jgi:hypothetical protein
MTKTKAKTEWKTGQDAQSNINMDFPQIHFGDVHRNGSGHGQMSEFMTVTCDLHKKGDERGGII